LNKSDKNKHKIYFKMGCENLRGDQNYVLEENS
jgi:hypothetical protein